MNINLSPNEQQIAASRPLMEWADAPNVDIWLIHLGRAGASERLTTDPAREFDPAWVLDGTEIVFNSNRLDGVTYSLFRRPADRSGDDRSLLNAGVTMSAPD